MIRSLADLLSALVSKGRDKLDEYSSQLTHAGLIGDMYEGLTKEILNRSVFEGLDLRVVDGQIRGVSGQLSKQIDCMIVHGEADQIPYTTSYVYPVERVLAVVEVKKNLYSDELEQSYENLLSVAALENNTDIRYNGVRAAFWHVSNDDIPQDDPNRLSRERALLYYCLAKDQQIPLRFIVGYRGFKTEAALRAHFIQLLESRAEGSSYTEQKRIGPIHLPSLVICGSHCLVKLNGMPYGAHLTKDWRGFSKEELWPLYASCTGKPSLMLLELLWTRLRQVFALSVDIFGEDLEVERLNLLLMAKPLENGKGWGYLLNDVDDTALPADMAFDDWEPALIDVLELVGFDQIIGDGFLDLENQDLQSYLHRESVSVEEFVDRMLATRLVARGEDGRLRALATDIAVAFLPDGRMAIDRQDSPRMPRWALKQKKLRRLL